MKKGICILLSLFLLLFTAGCGNKDNGSGVENIFPQTDGQEGQSTDYEQGVSGTEIKESSEAVSEPEQESDMETKTLVVYFSATGTTKPLAEYAAEILNADLYEKYRKSLILRKIWHIIRMAGQIRSKTILLHALRFLVVWKT